MSRMCVTSRALSVAERLNVMEWAECDSGALPEKEYLDLIAQARWEIRGQTEQRQPVR